MHVIYFTTVSVLVGGIVGPVSFLLAIGVVLIVIVVCCYVTRLTVDKKKSSYDL